MSTPHFTPNGDGVYSNKMMTFTASKFIEQQQAGFLTQFSLDAFEIAETRNERKVWIPLTKVQLQQCGAWTQGLKILASVESFVDCGICSLDDSDELVVQVEVDNFSAAILGAKLFWISVHTSASSDFLSEATLQIIEQKCKKLPAL